MDIGGDRVDPRNGEHPAQAALGRRRVLLLNASWEPLGAVGFQRAVVMLVCGKAELVAGEADGRLLHSERRVVPAPSVIQLCVYVRVPFRARAPMTRAAVMGRDRHRCVYCGDRADTIDHVVPRSRGGAHNWENCVACCGRCNMRKADRLLADLGWALPAAPSAPRGRHFGLLGGTAAPDPLWLPYLGEGAA